MRAPQDLRDRLDAHLARLRTKTPQFKVHRSDLVRALVERALAIEENDARSEVGATRSPFLAEPGESTLSPAARVVLDAVRVATQEWDLSDFMVPLARVYSRCRGIARRDYEEGLRTLERFGFITLHRAIDLGALTEADRVASLLDPRGTLVVAELNPSRRASAPRSQLSEAVGAEEGGAGEDGPDSAS